MSGPLQGIRVIDLTTVVAGPYATQMLGDLGAEVVKIETPHGDIMRSPGPSRSSKMGAVFLNCNRNKTSVILDLKTREGRDVLLAMIEDADVFIHNMRPAAIARLGLTYDELQARNPRLVYCAIVGFGQGGPYRDRPAYDDIIQAAAGCCFPDQGPTGAPQFAPTILADKTAALFAVGAINAGLLHKERSGEGQYIEVPMYESMVSFMLVEHLGGRTFVPPEGPAGYRRLMSPHRRPHCTKDGYISVLPYTAAHWRAFFSVAGREQWAQDSRLSSDAARSEIIDELYQRLADCLAERTTSEWIDALSAADIPCSRVNRLDELLSDEHLNAIGYFERISHPSEGEIITLRPPVRFSRTPCEVRMSAPSLGVAETRPSAEADARAKDPA